MPSVDVAVTPYIRIVMTAMTVAYTQFTTLLDCEHTSRYGFEKI